MTSNSRANWLLLFWVLAFAVSSIWQIAARLNASWAIRESRLDIGYTHEIAGEQIAVWEFAAPTRSLNKLWLFYHPISPDTKVARNLRVELEDADTGKRLADRQIALSDNEFRNGRALVTLDDLSLSDARALRLTVQLPEVAESEGFYLHYQADEASSGQVAFGDTVIEHADLSMLWFASQRGFPTGHVLCGIAFLLALRIASRNEVFASGKTLLADTVIVWALALMIGGYLRDLSVDRFYGNFWPDEYPAMARDWLTLLRGELEWDAFRERLSEWRNGQVFLVPMALGLVQYLGADPATAYQILVALFTGGALGIFVYAGKRFAAIRSWEWIAVYACFLTSPYLLHAAGSFQTDSAGLFFSFLALILIWRIAGESSRNPALALAGLTVALVAASVTRLSNLALLGLPACVALWMFLATDQKGPAKKSVLWASSALGIGFCALIWSQLGLVESLQKAKAFSELPQFRSQFSWERYGTQTLLACWPALIALKDLRSIRANPLFYTLGGGICALLLVLAVGKIIPWQRYWIPIAIPALFLGFAFAASRKRRTMWIAALAIGSVSLNLWLLL